MTILTRLLSGTMGWPSDNMHQENAESDWKRFRCLQLFPSASKLVESRLNQYFLTGLPCVHWIQMRWTALVLGISRNLFDCTLNKISKEHIDALPQTGKFNGSAWNRSESPGSAWIQLSVIEAHR